MITKRKPNLTKKQKQVLDYIKEFIEAHNYAPSYEEIAAGIGLSSPSTIYVHVVNLIVKGYLKSLGFQERNIEFLFDHPGRAVVSVRRRRFSDLKEKFLRYLSNKL